MNIELRFLQKAIEDKNYISFSYENKKLSKIKPLKLLEKEGTYTLKTDSMSYIFSLIKRLQVHKERF